MIRNTPSHCLGERASGKCASIHISQASETPLQEAKIDSSLRDTLHFHTCDGESKYQRFKDQVHNNYQHTRALLLQFKNTHVAIEHHEWCSLDGDLNS